MTTQNKRLTYIIIAAEALLFIPLVAMRFTTEVNWTPMDFIVMGAMLLVTALGIEAALHFVRVTWARALAVLVVIFCFLMVWGTLVHLGG